MTLVNEYSAGLMAQSFWFVEFKTVAGLRQSGLSYAEIKAKCIAENLFGAVNATRTVRMAGYLINRVKTMDSQLLELFFTSDLQTQKLINLITILKNDRLFFEFVYEVYREKVVLGIDVLDAADVNVFFTKKDAQSAGVAGWKDSTKRHLRSNYLNFMTDANLLAQADAQKKQVTPPIIDVALERYLQAHGEIALLKALTGES